MAKTKAAKGETIRIDPVTRIEGHLRIEALVDGGEVKDARCSGTLFRGFENILPGRHPLDAVRLTQRVCGVCPTAHATASAFALDEALGVADRIPANGRIVRNLIFGSNFLQSHILHFFALAALDYADVTAAADYDGPETDLKQVRAFIDRKSLSPFFPRYEGDYRCDKKTNLALVRAYVQALRIRRISHEMHSIFGGKMPHNVAIVPGGVTVDVTADKIASFFGKLQQIQAFIEDVYIPAIFTVAKAYGDYFDIGRGCGRFLSYGAFNLDGASADPLARKRLLPAGLVDADGKLAAVSAARIAEDVAHSRYADECAGAPPEGKTIPQPDKKGAYSWLKAPRYDGAPAEVGPLARALVAHAAGDAVVKREVDAALKAAGVGAAKLPSVLGRHLARALETRIVAKAMSDWLGELAPGEPAAVELAIPQEGRGAGLTDAPRGALGHWIGIKDKVIGHYQLVVPTTWNASPRDADGTPGPMEQALLGTKVKDRENPFEVVRIIRSFDPCLACSVHLVEFGKGESVAQWVI
ncbi:MAG TPA: nickel-dependent hydrogenase large subunit [Phycisphaerae bacterium]|nr:nickel-dependent hydrogenase large subunit [Phycisphaerae bacterium]